jgi:hypothetical protein
MEEPSQGSGILRMFVLFGPKEVSDQPITVLRFRMNYRSESTSTTRALCQSQRIRDWDSHLSNTARCWITRRSVVQIHSPLLSVNRRPQGYAKSGSPAVFGSGASHKGGFFHEPATSGVEIFEGDFRVPAVRRVFLLKVVI